MYPVGRPLQTTLLPNESSLEYFGSRELTLLMNNSVCQEPHSSDSRLETVIVTKYHSTPVLVDVGVGELESLLLWVSNQEVIDCPPRSVSTGLHR